MARKVFFSFHYERDVWRAGQVRNSNVITSRFTELEFIDGVNWETVKRQEETTIKRWIDAQLEGTSVTVVLIGSETAGRTWVNYEITKSIEKRNGLIGIYIHNMKDQHKKTDQKGNLPARLSTYPCYDWVNNDGYNNIGTWIEQAAQQAGR